MVEQYWRSSPDISLPTCHLQCETTCKVPFSFHKASWDFISQSYFSCFHDKLLLQYWSSLIPFIFLTLEKKFKVIPSWIDTVGDVPHRIPQIHSSNKSNGKLMSTCTRKIYFVIHIFAEIFILSFSYSSKKKKKKARYMTNGSVQVSYLKLFYGREITTCNIVNFESFKITPVQVD